MPIKKALTVAGSDSGSGAGIQADLKTFAALGVYGSTVITAVTAQNTRGLANSVGMTAQLVDQQLAAVLADIGADAVKTGMLYDQDIIEVIAGRLDFHKVPCLVVDPVMVASSGDDLLNSAGIDALREKLVPRATFITPNKDEAAALCGFPVCGERDLRRAAQELHRRGSEFVIITGIRRDLESIDFCYDGNEYRTIKGPFINTPHTHGTGCSFSAALTACRARGASPWTAVYLAKQYVAGGLRYAYQVGQGRGPLNHLAAFFPGRLADPDIVETRRYAFTDWGTKPRLHPRPLLNLIIGGSLCTGQDYVKLTRLAVQNGARLIQLREKQGDTRQLVGIAAKMCEVCHDYGTLFVVNDRVDVAIASGADGVHIGQDDLSPALARALLGPGKIIGISVGNLDEAEAALAAGADYLGVGPVYPTLSKDCRYEACGPELLTAIAARTSIPLIAIGGINPSNTRPLIEAGADGVAVISAVLGALDPAQAIREFMQVLPTAGEGCGSA